MKAKDTTVPLALEEGHLPCEELQHNKCHLNLDASQLREQAANAKAELIHL